MMNTNRKARTTWPGRRAVALLAAVVALGAATTTGLAAPAGAAAWEEDLLVREYYYVSAPERYVLSQCRVDAYPIPAKNLPGYMTVDGKVRCNHRLLAGGLVWFSLGSHGGTARSGVAELHRIRTGSKPDQYATFSTRVYIGQIDYRSVGGPGTWAVRDLELDAEIRNLNGNRLWMRGEVSGTVETFRAY
jgi:hypothetical protein